MAHETCGFYTSRPARPEQQTVVQLREPLPEENEQQDCPGKPAAKWLASVFLVTADLSGPDPNVDPGTFGIMRERTLLMFDGKPNLVNGNSVWWDHPAGTGLQNYCDFRFR